MIPIETKVDWNSVKADYIGGASYGDLARRHGLSKSTIFKKAKKEHWQEQRERTANAVETQTIMRTAEAAADNAVIAMEIKKKLLLRLKRIEEKYPLDATEIRTKQGNSTAIFRIRDLTAAYKDLTGDMSLDTQNDSVRIIIDV